jgi:ABC-type glycerol-3-phosphate transport system permease component
LSFAARRIPAIFITVVVILAALVFVFPFYWMIVLGSHTNPEVYSFPPPLLPGDALADNFGRVVEAFNLLKAMWNSIYVAVFHTTLVLFFSSLVGYGFSRFREAPGNRWMWGVVLATVFVPPTVGLIPWYMLMKWLGWIDTLWPLIIPAAANGFAVFWMRQYIDEAIPTELYDAARIDGASDPWIYWRIVLPLIRPALGALAVWTFMLTWTNFQIPLIILNDASKFTMPLALTSLNQVHGTDTSAVMLGSALSVLPIFVAFLLAARQFMSGLTAGAVKG